MVYPESAGTVQRHGCHLEICKGHVLNQNVSVVVSVYSVVARKAQFAISNDQPLGRLNSFAEIGGPTEAEMVDRKPRSEQRNAEGRGRRVVPSRTRRDQ